MMKGGLGGFSRFYKTGASSSEANSSPPLTRPRYQPRDIDQRNHITQSTESAALKACLQHGEAGKFHPPEAQALRPLGQQAHMSSNHASPHCTRHKAPAHDQAPQLILRPAAIRHTSPRLRPHESSSIRQSQGLEGPVSFVLESKGGDGRSSCRPTTRLPVEFAT
jgi:hypothetical protein